MGTPPGTDFTGSDTLTATIDMICECKTCGARWEESMSIHHLLTDVRCPKIDDGKHPQVKNWTYRVVTVLNPTVTRKE